MTAPLLDPGYGGTVAVPGTTQGGREQPATLRSLNAVTTGTGAVLDLGANYASSVCVLNTHATSSAGAVTFEGSLDSVTWYPLANAVTLSDGIQVTSSVIPARYLRARVSATVTGTGANVTADVSAA